MNKYIKKIGMAFGCVLLVSSCAEVSFWDNFLGDQPESSGATTEEIFSTQANAERVLTYAYTGLMQGIPSQSDSRVGDNLLESITDLCHSFRDNIGDGPRNLYYTGMLSPTVSGLNNSAYYYGNETDWTTIRYAWLFLENVDRVPDMTAEMKDIRKAEAKMRIALSYFNMMRFIGGVPWLDHAVDVNETMNFPRISFAQTVRNIEAMLNDVIDNSNLPWKQADTDYGRMTKAGAMALKVKLLHFAASPTFSSNLLGSDYAGNSGVTWQEVVNAAQAFFNAVDQNGGYALVQPTDDSHRARRLAYRQAYFNRGSSEVLISVHKGSDYESTHSSFYANRYYYGPTLNYACMFAWDDGTDFVADPDDPTTFDWANPSRQPFFTPTEVEVDGETFTEMVPTRDPRLYENVACPGDDYYNGTGAPVNTNHSSYHIGTGFLVMKYVLQQSSDRSVSPEQYCHTRLAEIMLCYAEALNEVNNGPTSLAYDMVDDVRARVGMPALPDGLSKNDFLEALLKERAMELGFEDARWFDLIRRDREADFRKTLYGLNSLGLDDRDNPTQFEFAVEELGARYWKNNWDRKWYLSPIPQTEINKDYGMVQNPGW